MTAEFEGRRPRDRHDRHYLQRDLSGLGPDAAGRKADHGTRLAGEHTVDRAKADLLSEKQPSHEFATPEQIGALTVFLCSDAAAHMRGAALPVDGGWTAQ